MQAEPNDQSICPSVAVYWSGYVVRKMDKRIASYWTAAFISSNHFYRPSANCYNYLMRVLVFGDSITQGFWAVDGGWVEQLRKHYDGLALKDLRNNQQPTIFNLGISGGTSKTILARFDSETRARSNGEALAFIFSTGVNDSYREGRDKYKSTSEEYAKNLEELVATAKRYSDKILFVGLVAGDEAQTAPVFWRDIYYLNDRIKLFEDAMKKVANENSISFKSVFEEFKEHLDSGENLLADGLHPNNEGHELIFELVRPELDKLLAG